MKKSLLICLFILLSSFIFAQTFDVIKEYSFNDIPYYEDVIDDIPYYVKSIDTLVSNGAGISRVEIYKDKIVGINASKNSLFESSNIFNQLDLTVYPYTFLKRNNTLIVGTEKKFLLYIDSNNLLEPDYILSIPGDSIKLAYSNKDSFYVVNNRVFAITEKNELIQWKLLGNGKTEFIDIENTKKELADGLQEQLGIHSNNNNVNYFFGENFISSVGFPNIENSLNNLKYFPEKYNFIKGLQGYHYLGTSNKGISIYYKYKKVGTIDTTKNPDTPITIMLAVVDPWTRNVNIVELPEGGINPPRNAEKGFIAFCSQCMDEDGNLYFTDVNKEKGVYQIKKVSNEWLNNYDFSNRKIGIVNSNQVDDPPKIAGRYTYPEDIQEKYFETHERIPTKMLSPTVAIKKGCAILFALAILVGLMLAAGAYNFWSAFLLSYGMWFIIDWYDCFFLDWVLFANIKRIRLPGTENMDKEYHQKKYHVLRSLLGMLIGLIPCVLCGTVIAIIK